MHAFSAHFRELWPQTYSPTMPLELSEVTCIPRSTTMEVAYKPEVIFLQLTFVRQLCDNIHLSRWLLAFFTHSQTFTPTPVSFTQMANHRIQQATRKSFHRND